MSTVYVVTEGSYSDYHIVAVFSDYNKAKIFSLTLGDDAVVETYDVDGWEVDTDKKIINYAVVLYKPFTAEPIERITIHEGLEGRVDFNKFKIRLSSDSTPGPSIAYINTDSIEKAKKIFYDEYAKLLNEYAIEMGKQFGEENDNGNGNT